MDNFTFIAKVFKDLGDDELPIVINGTTGWKAEWPKPSMKRRPGAWYFSCAAHKIEGKPKRSKHLFSTAHCFVLDDVGTKVPADSVQVAPSWIMETSLGNFQYGYLIHPYPYARKYEEAMRLLSDAGLTDKGCIDCVHLFRLPDSLHRTGWRAQLIKFDARKRRHLSDWLRDFGIDLPESMPEMHTFTRGRPVDAKTIAEDSYWQFLCEQGYVLEDINESGWAGIICPWADRHTVTDDPKYQEARYKPGTRIFRCFHGACSDRHNQDLYTWIGGEMRAHILAKVGHGS